MAVLLPFQVDIPPSFIFFVTDLLQCTEDRDSDAPPYKFTLEDVSMVLSTLENFGLVFPLLLRDLGDEEIWQEVNEQIIRKTREFGIVILGTDIIDSVISTVFWRLRYSQLLPVMWHLVFLA